MSKYVLFFTAMGIAMLYFAWGINQSNKAERADCEKDIITKEQEVIKYVYKEKAAIYSKPNANRSGLIELMRSNRL